MTNSTQATPASANALTFNFSTQALRVVMINGEPWFVASDVCGALALSNTTKALLRLDEDEQALISIQGISRGNDQVNVINESGLYSLVLGSRKPEAKTFKKWVTAEVLPTIRKTGRYVEPTAEPKPTPRSTGEQLNPSDMQHMKRIVWMASKNFHFTGPATQGFWYYLRQATNNPAPNAYTTDQIPVLAAELRRIVNLSEQVGAITRHVEEQAIKRIFRKGETADKVLQQLAAEAERNLHKLTEHIAEFPSWMKTDLLNFTERRPAYQCDYYNSEQPDFFLSAA